MPKVSEVDLAEKKTEILSGARRCFATYGYDGATVARLEEATGKSRGAIFHHYGNKDSLFLAVAHDDMKKMAEVAAQDGLIGVIRTMIDDHHLSEWWGMRVEIIRRVNTDPCFGAKWDLDQLAFRDTVRDRLKEQQRSGKMRTDVSIDTMASLLETLMEGVLARLAQGQGTEGVPSALDFVEEMLRT